MMHRKQTCAAVWVLLALMLPLLSGCAQMVQERPLEDLSGYVVEPETQAPAEDGYVERTQDVTLYFISAQGDRLVPVTREVTMHDGMSRAQAALEALTGGPLEGETDAVWPDAGGVVGVRSLELSGGVATVSLPSRYRVLNPETLYAVRLAVAGTLCELPEISYVNVLVGGREEGLDLGATMPVGTLSRLEDLDVQARYARVDDQRQSDTGFTCLTTLYFPTQDGTMLLPMVRSVAYAQASPVDYLYTLLSELGKGTNHELTMQNTPAPMDYIEEMPEIVRPEDGANRAIEIRFSRELLEALESAGLKLDIYLAMLTDTLMGFVPGVEGLQVYLGGERIDGLEAEDTTDGEAVTFSQALITRDAFDGCIGAPATLCAESAQAGKLVRVQCVLPQARQGEPRKALEELISLSGKGYVALPSGLGAQDILAVRVEEENVVVHLSGAFAQALQSLTARQARVAVYAMVNTLTEGRDQQGVIFFFDGEQIGELAGGLNLRGRLLRNPGMVVD